MGLFWKVTVLVLVSAAFSASQTSSRVALALDSYLRTLIVNPKGKNGVRIEIVGRSEGEMDQGRLQLITISSSPAQIKGVYLKEFRGRVVDAVIDVPALLQQRKLITVRVKESVVDGVLDGEALEKMFALGKSTRPMKIQVQVLNDVVRLTGVLTLIGINNPFEALCRVISRPEGLYVMIEELKVNGIPAPGFLRSRLEKKINPVVDRNDLPFSPEIRSVRFKNGLILVSSNPEDPSAAR